MPDIDGSNGSSPSTTWEWRKVKMRRPPEAEHPSASGASSVDALLPWPKGRRLHVTIKYRGGPEAWYEIEARGRVWRRPGHVALHDIARTILGHR